MMPATAGVGVLAMGMLLAKKIPVMINWTVGPANLLHVLRTADVSVVITSKAFLQRLPKTTDLTPLLDKLLFFEDVKTDFYYTDMIWAKICCSYRPPAYLTKKYDVNDVHPDDVAVILFTSGSESAPKGVPLTHRNVLSNISGVGAVAGLDVVSDILLGVLPPFHSFGWTITTLIPLVTGLRAAYFPNPTDYAVVARQITKWNATVYAGTPTFLAGVLRNAPEGDKWKHNLRLCVTGAEKLPDALRNEAKDRGVKDVLEGYGITECAPVVSCHRPTDKERLGVGKPIPGVKLRIVDIADRTQILEKPGQRGVILVQSSGVFPGYIKNPDQPKKNPFVSFYSDSESESEEEEEGWVEGRWYDTGDLGEIDEDGNLLLRGRLKRFVKVAGEMISLGALEEALRKVWKSDEDGETIALEALEKAGEKSIIAAFCRIPIKRDEICNALRDAGFAAVTFPTCIVDVSEIPLLGTGKTDFRSLKEQLVKRFPNMKPDF
eukprot:TRINITY_DN14283_c0_g1_i1.p1 TRINITY_DN14283_c0_g1~~TRINITY_DN14283_c0_g1_i1.p1  ORF type:complete len:492 (-),score=90.81 TRINITY_DN14283_c0_g1_i1:737-2212(-)